MIYVLVQELMNLDVILSVYVNGIKMKNIVHAHPYYKELSFVQIMIILHAKHKHNSVYGMIQLKNVELNSAQTYKLLIVIMLL